ncbi:MAG: NF038122 family metalloprotease [Rhodomicrobium sp.]
MSLTIVPTFDGSVTGSADAGGYEAAVNTAISFFEQHFTNVNNVVVDLTFSFNSSIGGAVGENYSYYQNYTYSQVYDAIETVDGASSATATQMEAAASLASLFGASDPTGGGAFWLTTADARALGLDSASSASGLDSTITLNSSDSFTWSQSGGIAANTFDAVGTLEHEISEALGRTAFLGQNVFGDGADYNVLDLFHFGSAGQLAEPFNTAAYDAFVNGGSAYFSIDGGRTQGLPFSSYQEVRSGNDVADWSSTVSGDSFGYATAGLVDPSRQPTCRLSMSSVIPRPRPPAIAPGR